jgi:large subunit ribosomal protein L6
MSRIGNQPITIATSATITIDGRSIVVKGSKGELSFVIPMGVDVVQLDGVLTVSCKRNDRPTRALHGFVRAHIANMIHGVTEGWTKTLELTGVGYRAAMSGANLTLNVGFSHQVTIAPPVEISFSVVEGKIVVSGIDKQAVGQIAAEIREVRKPEPYKGKGIKYQGERIRKKAGKSAKAVGGAPGK